MRLYADMIKTMLMLGNEKTTIIPYVCLIFGYILVVYVCTQKNMNLLFYIDMYINDKE